MSSPSHRSSSPPLQQPLQPRQSRSPTTSMSTSTSTAATTTTHNTTPSKTGGSTHHHHHHHHLPVGHTLHSPAQSASGDFIQGNPEDAGGLHTSTSRGNILLPPSTLPGTGITTTASATPADLLSVSSAASRTPGSSVAAYSRPASPSSASAGAGALLPPSSPSMLGAASTASHTATATRSRPISPTRSRSPVIPSSPRSPNLKQQHQAQDADVLSMSSSTPQLDSSAVFERDVEFANDHLLTGSEAIDLAAAPVLSEVALAVTSNDLSSIAPSPPSSNILAGLGGIGNIGGSGSGASGTASPLLAHQSLDSTILSSSPQLPSNAVLFNNEGQQITSSSSASSSAVGYGTTNTVPLSEQLRRSSGGANSALASISGSAGERIAARPTSDEFTISPPPSLSLSPSASTNSPISSTPGSPIQSLHPAHHLASGAGVGIASVGGTGTPIGASGGAQFGHALNSMEELDPEAPLEGVETGLTSPPGSSSAMSGISLSGSKDSKRRLSMISYADIINSERLSDTHSGFSSPTPSSALSISAAALPVQSGQQSPTPAHYGAAAIASTGGTANVGSPPVSPGLGGLAAGTGSALYSPLTSPEGSIASPPISGSTGLVSDKQEHPTLANREENLTQEESPVLQKPANNRTDTMSTTATEVFYMPGQMPLHTPPAHHNYKEDKDVTPTSSSIRKASPPFEANSEQEGGSATADTETLKHSTSTSSWSMVEMGKALVGSAAGAVGSVLGASGIGNGDDDDVDDNEEEKRKAAKAVQADH